ncbi:Imm61 family immunity protein [Mycobacterium sp. C31M]
MTTPVVSERLVELALSARYSLTPEDGSGAALFWSNPGGEIRFYLRRNASGGITMTSSERAGTEQFELAAVSMEVMERHLFGIFHHSVRSRHRLPRLEMPCRREEIADGHWISDQDSAGYIHLFGVAGTLLASDRGGLGGVGVLVELSHLIASPLEDIKRSYEDPEGRPLFVRAERQSRNAPVPRRFHDDFFSRENRYSIGTDTASARRYLSIPVTSSAVGYEEYYELSQDDYDEFLANERSAVEFAESCRRREQDSRLILKPGWNRGTPV